MANTFTKFDKGLVLIPSTAPTATEDGELQYRDSDDRFLATYNSVTGEVVISNAPQTLTEKTITNSPGLSVSGTTTLNTLTVTGTFSRHDSISVTGTGASITGGLSVTSGTINFFDDVNAASGIDITSGGLDVVGGITAQGGLQLDSGNTTLAGTLGVTGNVTTQGFVSASALTSLGAINASGNLFVGGTISGETGISITGTSHLFGAVTAQDIYLTDNLNVPEISTPTNPATGRYKIYPKSDGALRILNSDGVEKAVGSPQGSGTLRWVVDAEAPLYQQEYNKDVYLFQSGSGTQHLYSAFKIPTDYVLGSQIRMKMPMYAPATAGTILLKTIVTLIRPGLDAVTSVTNQRTSTNSAATLAAGSSLVEVINTFDLTSTIGEINAVAVSGDYTIKVDLIRGTDTCTADLRADVYSTEILFG